MSSTKAIPFSIQRRQPRQPLLWAALAYGAGIAVGAYTWRPPLWWVAAAVGFVAAGAYCACRRVGLGFSLPLGALFFTGAFAIQLRSAEVQSDDGVLAFADGEEVVVTGHVIHEGEIREAGFGGVRQSVDLETEDVTRGGRTMVARIGLRVGIYGKESDQQYKDDGTPMAMRIFRYGERLCFAGKVRASRKSQKSRDLRLPRMPRGPRYRGAGVDQEHED